MRDRQVSALRVPRPGLCTDNGAMVAALGCRSGRVRPTGVGAGPSGGLGAVGRTGRRALRPPSKDPPSGESCHSPGSRRSGRHLEDRTRPPDGGSAVSGPIKDYRRPPPWTARRSRRRLAASGDDAWLTSSGDRTADGLIAREAEAPGCEGTMTGERPVDRRTVLRGAATTAVLAGAGVSLGLSRASAARRAEPPQRRGVRDV